MGNLTIRVDYSCADLEQPTRVLLHLHYLGHSSQPQVVRSFYASGYLLLSPNGDYALHMDKNNPTLSALAARNIKIALADRDLKKTALANQAGIPTTSFDRKLKHPEQFTLKDIGSIAEALDIPFTELIKDAA